MARKLMVSVISDVHLGTHGCHALELLNYLKSIDPEILILNGDIIDAWQFSKRYFPQTHFEVINEILHKAAHGTRLVYITGNHDEFLRRYSDQEIGNIILTDKFVLSIGDQKTCIFHGDVFDNTTKGFVKMLAKLGGKSYDLLILLNRAINWMLKIVGHKKVSFSKRVKNSVKKAVSYINNFEEAIAELALAKGYNNVICGHIHQPCIKNIVTEKGSVQYLNSGDWVENLTALEFNGAWELYNYDAVNFSQKSIPLYKSNQKIAVDLDDIDKYYQTLQV